MLNNLLIEITTVLHREWEEIVDEEDGIIFRPEVDIHTSAGLIPVKIGCSEDSGEFFADISVPLPKGWGFAYRDIYNEREQEQYDAALSLRFYPSLS